MPKEFGRNRRVAQFIKEELSVLIQREFPLSQYGMITLTNVDVSPDLKNATIYITALKNNSSGSVPDKSPLLASMQANEELVAELNEQAGHFRHEISRIMTSKGVPSLRFKYDKSIERAQRLTDIIYSVSHSDNDDTPV
ncbi:MAG: ribosome-binding factor A [Proteobacteria bacterium]|nr:ribosome-binding factor A [Pseudomonadota bacterium]